MTIRDYLDAKLYPIGMRLELQRFAKMDADDYAFMAEHAQKCAICSSNESESDDSSEE